jgi:glucokinase
VACTLGIDFGGTKLLACLLDEDGRPMTYTRRATGRAYDPDRMVREVADIVAAVRSQGVPLTAAGFGFPGLVNMRKGVVLSSVILDGWKQVPLAQQLSAATGLPCVIDNDVNNAARAELHTRGPGNGMDMLFVAVGTGIGGALVLDGRVWQGVTGLAGEIGHVSIARDGPLCRCGRRGCIGAVASGASIEARLRLSDGTLGWAVGSGKASALAVIEEAAESLGVGLASVLNLLNLPLVVLGGGVAEVGMAYLTAVLRAVRREAFPEVVDACRIELARAGYDAGAVGAALLARELIEPKNPPCTVEHGTEPSTYRDHL